MDFRFRNRRGTAAQWADKNPVLGDGEFGYVKDTKILKVGDGVTHWNDLPDAFDFIKASDSDKLDGIDSSGFVKVTDLISRDRGTGATWPTTDLRRGDFYFHTAVSQIGVYTGAGWRLIEPGFVATTAARDALSWAYPNMRVICAADGLVYEYQNNFIGWTRPWNQPWGELAWSGLTLNYSMAASYSSDLGWAIYPLPKGRKIRIRGQSYWYTGSGTMTTIRTRVIVRRDSNATPTTIVGVGADMDRRIGGSALDLSSFVYDTPFTITGTAGGSVNTLVAIQGMYAGTAPGSALYMAGSNTEQNYITIVDVGPATAPPTS